MEVAITLAVLTVLMLVWAIAQKASQFRSHARLKGIRVRLGLTETMLEEQGLMSVLTGRKGTNQLTFVGRPWKPLEVRTAIPATLPLGLSLTPQGKGSHLRGMQDIQVGVPDLDAHFQVQGEHPAAAIRYLREEQTQQALRALITADPQASVTHGEVRLTLANLEIPGLLERTVQLSQRLAQELAEATGAPNLPAAAAESSPALSAPARGPEIASRPLRPTSEEPPITAVVEGGLIRPRFSPGYLAEIQRVHGRRRLFLRCLYAVSAVWLTVLTLDRNFETSILFDLPYRHRLWSYLYLLSGLLIVGIRAVLRRCASCGDTLGEGFGVTRLVNKHSITCTNCGIELQ
ncbi:MAG TPA: hypothetical protein VF815_46635 [Myxococcaceae bacterium]|jgi:hypothetical protein